VAEEDVTGGQDPAPHGRPPVGWTGRRAHLADTGVDLVDHDVNFFALDRLTVPDDAAATVSNIVNSELLFRGGIAAFIVVLIADVVVGRCTSSSSEPAGSCRCSPPGSGWCTRPLP
jgi:hypothetical protein